MKRPPVHPTVPTTGPLSSYNPRPFLLTQNNHLVHLLPPLRDDDGLLDDPRRHTWCMTNSAKSPCTTGHMCALSRAWSPLGRVISYAGRYSIVEPPWCCLDLPPPPMPGNQFAAPQPPNPQLDLDLDRDVDSTLSPAEEERRRSSWRRTLLATELNTSTRGLIW